MNVSLRGCQKHWAEAPQLFEAGGELGVSEAYWISWAGMGAAEGQSSQRGTKIPFLMPPPGLGASPGSPAPDCAHL